MKCCFAELGAAISLVERNISVTGVTCRTLPLKGSEPVRLLVKAGLWLSH